VKVQFHWDREGQSNETSSLWIRSMMPWTGKNWGMIAVPRIGQEVVVQFEEGNPDRPVIIGMLYNADTMPPYTLPGEMTKSGVVTRSSKEGSASTFHELMFEDKKGAELVRFQSERDYRQIVKNDAEVTVGLEHKDKGDMKLTVHRHLTETVKTGNHTFSVQSGSQTIHIQKDKTETIKGNSTLTVTGDVSETIEQGNRTEEIKMGNVTRTIKMGNESTTLDLGNYTLETKVGKIGMKALQEIKLEVGGSSIKIDQMGVTIKGMMVKIEGTIMLEAKGMMTTVKGDAMLTLKGGITMIN
jgi:type VI secretion system secreted protein VgrG